MPEQRDLRSQRSPVLVASIAYFFLYSRLAVLSPYFQVYLRVRGYNPSEVGILLGCLSLAGIIGPLLMARLADRWQNYRVLLLCGLGASVVLFLPFQYAFGLWVAIPLVMAFGLAARSTGTLTDTFVSRIVADPAHQYGRIRVWGSIGFVATSLFIQLTNLMDAQSSLSIMAAFAVTGLLAMGASAFLPGGVPPRREKREEKPAASGQGGKTQGAFWIGMAIVFLGYIGMASHYSFFSLYLQETLGIGTVSLFWALSACAEIPFIFFSGPIIRRLGIGWSLSLAMGAMVVRLIVYALFPVVWVLLSAQLLHGFTFGLFHTASVIFIIKTVSEERRATGMALFFSLSRGGALMLGSAVGGFVVEAWGFPVLYLSFAVPPFLAMLLLMARRRTFSNV